MVAKYKLLKFIKRIFKLAVPDQQTCNNIVAQNMQDKEISVYGEDQIRQQKFYEAWVTKTSWHLKREAIPILLSRDPQQYSDKAYHVDQHHDDLWRHARHCIDQGLLPVLNKEAVAGEWRVDPVAMYKWATISRLEIPEQLSALMAFVISATKEKVDDNVTDQLGTSSQGEKEQILGAVLAVLVNYPKFCSSNEGQLQAQDIFALIKEHEKKLFGESPPDLSAAIVSDIINQWVKKVL